MRRWLLPSQHPPLQVTGEVKNLVVNPKVGAEVTTVTITADALDIGGVRATTVSVEASIAASGAGGLDTGAEAGDTHYYLWAIYNPATGTPNGLWSLSATAPTMPAGYTLNRLIGHRRNNNSSNLIMAFQCNDMVLMDVEGAVASISATADLDFSNFVPAAIADFVLVTVAISGSGTWSLTDKDQTGMDYISAAATTYYQVWVRKNAANLVTATENSGTASIIVSLVGYKVKVL